MHELETLNLLYAENFRYGCAEGYGPLHTIGERVIELLPEQEDPLFARGF